VKDGVILFLGTLEPRKNVGALLDAYALLRQRRPDAPPLLLAGRATPQADDWLRRIGEPPLAGHVTHLGYVAAEEREALYERARVLVLPSLNEGFGLTVLEAMSAGVPVVASNRGSLPEVLGGAGLLVDPTDVATIASALERIVIDDDAALRVGQAGLSRAGEFTWARTAATLRRAYADAVARRRAR
jgi:glycosyltransferase involved in cell wall biosynthesis